MKAHSQCPCALTDPIIGDTYNTTSGTGSPSQNNNENQWKEGASII